MRGTLLLLPLMIYLFTQRTRFSGVGRRGPPGDTTTAAFALFSTPFAAASEAMNFDAVASLLSPKGDVARR